MSADAFGLSVTVALLILAVIGAHARPVGEVRTMVGWGALYALMLVLTMVLSRVDCGGVANDPRQLARPASRRRAAPSNCWATPPPYAHPDAGR